MSAWLENECLPVHSGHAVSARPNGHNIVREHEPRLALDGGEDGLVFYRKIVKESKDYLKENGFLIFEIGYDEGNEVLQLMKDKFDVKIHKDLNNFDRVVVGRLKV